MAANQVDFKILPSDQFSVYSPATRSDKIITYFTLLSKLRGDILSVGQDDDPNNIVSAFYISVGGTQTLHLVKADGSEVTASVPEQIISGTVNFVSKFTTANDIGDSQIFDDGTNVGIGTTSMTHKLQLATGGVFADYFQLDTTYTNGFVVGAISWDIDNGTADIGLSSTLKLKVGQDDTWYVKNQSGSTITKGTVVYASGTLGASGRITIAPMIADGTIPSRFLLGIVAENILNGADGYVIAKGKIRQINTNAFNDGDVLWVSPTVAGALTVTEPTAPNLKLAIAFVVHKATNGVLAVRATTGVRIADASDVEYAGAADNSFLVYNNATGVWEDEAVGIFKTIAVTGQSNVVADTYDDTLTLVAGTNVTITTDATTDSITINSTDQFVGTVTSVGTSAPLTGGPITTTGTIGITQSGVSTDGYLSSTDWNIFNSKEPALTKGNLTEATSAVLTITGGTGAVIGTGTTIQVIQSSASASGFLSSADWTTFNSKQGALTFTAPLVNTSGTITITQSGAATDGYLSSTDWNAFNAKEPALTKGNLTEATSSVLTITNGTNAVIGSGTSIQVAQSSSTTNGYLSSTDWSTFNGKASNSFTTIAVATQSSIVADSATDTLTIAAGTGVAITTDALTDTLTISATGSGGTVTSIATTAPITGGTITSTGTIGITQSGAAADGYLSSTDWNTFNGKQDAITLTTTGTTGAATLVGATLNIPNYADQFTGTVTSVDLTAGTGITVSGGPITTSGSITVTNNDRGSSQNIFKNFAVAGQSTIVADTNDDTLTIVAGSGVTLTTNDTTDTLTISASGSGGTVTSVAALTIGTTGTDLSSTVVNGTTTPVITLNVPTASATNRGALSSTDWTTFNGKASNSFTTIAVATQNNIVADTATDTLTIVAGTGVTITTDDTTDTITISATGSGGTITGSGTANYVPKWTSASAIGDSAIYDNAGNIGIGTTSPSYKLDVTGDARINTGALGVNVAPSATDGRIDASNDIVAFSSSDLRLKENIKPIENALEKVKSLTGVEFDWKPELKHAHGYEGHDTGVIAQEVQEVMPTAIRTNDTGYLAVRYEKLIGLLIEANKELATRVEELESKFK